MQKVNHFSLRKTAMYGLTSCLIGIAFMGVGTTVKADENSKANTDIKTEEVQQEQSNKSTDKVSQPINADQQKSSDTQESDSKITTPVAKLQPALNKNVDSNKLTAKPKTDTTDQNALSTKTSKAVNAKESLPNKIITDGNEQEAPTEWPKFSQETKTINRTIYICLPDGSPKHLYRTDSVTFTRNKWTHANGKITYGSWYSNNNVWQEEGLIDYHDYEPALTKIEAETVTPGTKDKEVDVPFYWRMWIDEPKEVDWNVTAKIMNRDGTCSYETDIGGYRADFSRFSMILVKGGPVLSTPWFYSDDSWSFKDSDVYFAIMAHKAPWAPASCTFSDVQAPQIHGYEPDIKTVKGITVTGDSKNQQTYVTYWPVWTDKQDVTRRINVHNPDGSVKTTVQTVTFTRTDKEDATGIMLGDWDQGTNDSRWAKLIVPIIAGYTPTKSIIEAQKVTPDTEPKTIDIYYTYNSVKEIENKTITRTISFVDKSGKQLSPSVTQTVIFTRTNTQTTKNGPFIPGAWSENGRHTFAAVTVPTIAGYTSSQASVSPLDVTPDSSNTTVIVTYSKNLQPTTPPVQPTNPTEPTEPTQASQATQPAPVHPTVPPTQPTKPSQQIPPKATNSPQVAKPGQSAKTNNVKPKATRGGKESVSVEPQSERGKNDKHKILVLAQREQRAQKAEPISTKPNKQAKTLPQTGQRNNQAVAIGLAIVNLGLLILAGLGLHKRKN